jgi:hypothetical protein
MTRRYIPKQIPVEAVQWTGDNGAEIAEFAGDALTSTGRLVMIRNRNGLHALQEGWFLVRRLDDAANITVHADMEDYDAV